MRRFILIFFISVISFALTINYINTTVYAQDVSFKDITKKSINNEIESKTTDLSYKYEPFISLNGKDFEDISQNNTISIENFAIAAWINTNQSTLLEPAHIVNKGGFNTDEKGENMNYGIWFSTNGTISGGFETESGEDFEVKSTPKYNDGKWHYVLLSYDGSLLRLDIDGKKQVSTKQTNGAFPDNTGDQPLRIGANSLDEDKFFTGYIDEVRVWNRGLTDKEISEIYMNDTFDSKGLMVYLNFGGDGISTRNNISSSDINYTKSIKNLTSTTTNKGSVPNKINETTTSSTSSPLPPTPKTNATSTLTHDNNKATTTKEKSPSSFNIAVAADWGCKEDAKKTSKNIQHKNPELVIAAGDLSYEEQGDCWEDIISPFESKLKISMGDHEYHDTQGGTTGMINEYLNPLDLAKTYYSFDLNNVHFVFIDPYIDYRPDSIQYQFIEKDLKTASTNPKIDWTFVVEHIPMYTSPTKHSANSTIRDIYHPLFDKYGVDLVFSGDNHNYQRTFPLKYNNNNGGSYSSNNPIISNSDKNNYNADSGVIYLTTGTAGRSHYEIKQQASFVAKQDDKHFGFLNMDISGNTVKGTFIVNESEQGFINVGFQQNNRIIDHFTISKTDTPDNN
jgi:hypothetical protein